MDGCWPVSVSQTLIVASHEPESIRFPSGEKTTAVMHIKYHYFSKRQYLFSDRLLTKHSSHLSPIPCSLKRSFTTDRLLIMVEFRGRQRPACTSGGDHRSNSPPWPRIHPSSESVHLGCAFLSNSVDGVTSFSASQTLIVPSFDPDARYFPSDEYTIVLMLSGCPLNCPEMMIPLSTFHSVIVPSSEPDATCFPSGDSEMD